VLLGERCRQLKTGLLTGRHPLWARPDQMQEIAIARISRVRQHDAIYRIEQGGRYQPECT
jgi:hypothetical protein